MKFKEAFSPTFVHQAILACPTRPKKCLDPFGGSGTTALTCSFLGVDCDTIEVNPFLSDLIRAKTTFVDPSKIRTAAIAAVEKAPTLRVSLEDFCRLAPKTFCNENDHSRSIYQADVLTEILRLRAAIDFNVDETIRRLLRMALGSTLIALSNVVVNGKGRRYRGEKCHGRTTPAHVYQLFFAVIHKIEEDFENFQECFRAPTRVFTGDCRDLITPSGQYDLAVFSPPYPNSFDYTDVYNVELWILGYLKSSGDNKALRMSTLQSHVQINRNWREDGQSSSAVEDIYRQLAGKRAELWDARIPEMVRAYFQDIRLIMHRTAAALSSGGRLVLAVGDSRYAGIHVRVADLITAEAAQLGLILVESQTIRSMRSSAQHGGKPELQETSMTFVAA